MKKYHITVIRWEPQTVEFEIESENCMNAKTEALRRVRDQEFDQTEIDSTMPIRTTLLRCKRIKK